MSRTQTNNTIKKMKFANRLAGVLVVLGLVGYALVILITTTHLSEHKLALQENAYLRADIANAQLEYSTLVAEITNPTQEVVIVDGEEQVIEVPVQKPNKNVHFVAVNNNGPVVAYNNAE